MNISFILNNIKVNTDVPGDKPLLRVLREDFDVKSVKEGCGRGECGTCTILLDGVPVTSCMVAAGQVRGRNVTTLEGLESGGYVADLQQVFKESGAIQCGFCTPGFIMSAYALLKVNSSPDRDEIRQAISGNICRCTGYTKIIDAIELAAKYAERNLPEENLSWEDLPEEHLPEENLSGEDLSKEHLPEENLSGEHLSEEHLPGGNL